MNNITKKSFYSFLTLYLLSSFIFLFLASYWFYSSQTSMEMQNNYYKMNNIADRVSAKVIKVHMMGGEFTLAKFPDAAVALYDSEHKIKYGSELQNVDFSKDYYLNGKTFTLISQTTIGHLGVDHVVVQSDKYTATVSKLKNRVIVTSIFVGIAIVIIAVILSYIFLRPIKDKMQEIENFVKDTTHELNTPITALMMSTSRAKSKKVYDEKIIQNISISTKQLYDIYSSLSFLSFDAKDETTQELDFNEIVKESIDYFDELLERKNIKLEFTQATCILNIDPTKAKMLINNLLSNAIKYSLPNTKINIQITRNSFFIKDEGIGIAKDKLSTIFQRFTRANSYAGGFGVGLNIVDSIVKEYGFKIEINSKEKEGTEVIIRF
ncbi:HAMP domain-containing sensor histidine kinase [Sulfurimonas sp.]|uniref:sensor histidine kinase n=1 Tax=Sulfurimonas sp. TaxID=2022749 RepID=UPI0026372AB9|nr:HAMP domain-containing sensor histidine kinase [Sulfurimonas sp.]MCW8894614.1 HAMP domain-containing histidine kinase [Sulfurimonas sp.]MCW9067436.1 HAMP domain-containing histidine kinase [Sulfurimonas sp.]